MKKYYYLNEKEESEGPFSKQELKNKHAEGLIDDNTLYSFKGMPDWRPVRELLASGAGGIDATPPPIPPEARANDDLKTNAWRFLVSLYRVLFGLGAKIVSTLRSILARFNQRKEIHDPLELRIKRLEGKNRALSCVVVLSIGVGILAHHDNSPSRPLELRDASGNLRWRVGMGKDGSVYQALYDVNGQSRIYMGILSDNGSTIQMDDENGTNRYQLNTLDNGLFNQRICDSSGRLRLLDYTQGHQSAGQELYSAYGNLESGSDIDENGTPHQLVIQSEGQKALNTIGNIATAWNIVNTLRKSKDNW